MNGYFTSLFSFFPPTPIIFLFFILPTIFPIYLISMSLSTLICKMGIYDSTYPIGWLWRAFRTGPGPD